MSLAGGLGSRGEEEGGEKTAHVVQALWVRRRRQRGSAGVTEDANSRRGTG